MLPILPLLASINSKYYVAIGLTLVIGLMGLRIGWLNHRVDRLEGKSVKIEAQLDVAADINELNLADARKLQERLNECSIANLKLEALGESAVSKLERELENSEESTRKAVKSIKESLQGETCANTPIPRDVERKLRKAATSTH